MGEGVFERNPFLRVILNQTFDEIPRAFRDVGRKMKIDGLNAPIGVDLRGALEWRLPDEKLVGENAKRPVIYALVVRFILDHFRRQVVQRAAQRLAPRGGSVDGLTEIGDLHFFPQSEQKIFGFYVAMNHFFRVTIYHGIEEFRHVGRRPRLVELPLGLQHFVQLPLGGELEDEIDARFVVEIAVQAKNVGVTKVRLNLDLAPQLVFHVGLIVKKKVNVRTNPNFP